MCPLPFTVENGVIRLHGFPEAAFVANLPSSNPLVRQLHSLALCHVDMQNVIENLDLISSDKDTSVNRALFESALIKFFKCYTSSASRIALNSEKVLKNASKEALKGFSQYKAIRDKHIAHDENSYTNSVVFAVINNKNSDKKIAAVSTNVFVAELYELNCLPLRNLAVETLNWIVEQIDELSDKIKAMYEERPREELMALEPAQYTVPCVDDLFKPRSVV